MQSNRFRAERRGSARSWSLSLLPVAVPVQLRSALPIRLATCNRPGDPIGCLLGLLDVAAGQDHRRLALGELLGRFVPQSHVGTGYHDDSLGGQIGRAGRSVVQPIARDATAEVDPTDAEEGGEGGHRDGAEAGHGICLLHVLRVEI